MYHASCPGGFTAVSQGPPSTSVPSAILTFFPVEIIHIACGAWQVFVLTNGLTHFSQSHLGKNVALPITILLRFTISIFRFSNVLTSSG